MKTSIIHQLLYWQFEIERVWRQFTISPASHQQLTLFYQQSNNSTQTNAIPLRVDLTQYQSLSAVADLRMGAREMCPLPPVQILLMSCKKRLNCQEVSRCRTRGESEKSITCMRGSTQARDPPKLWNRRADVTTDPKQGCQWPHKNNWSPSNYIKKPLVLGWANQ